MAKVALITGASRGIGRAVAVRAAASGHHVVAVARSPDALQETVALCRHAGGDGGGGGEIYPADLTDPAAVRGLIAHIAGVHGGLEVLVNNAGAYHHAPLAKTSAEMQSRLIGLNVTAPIHLTSLALPLLERRAKAAGRAVVVIIASVAGKRGIADEALYASTKHAMVGLGASVFAEARDKNIAVTTLCPGLVATDMASGRGANLDCALRAEDIADAFDYVLACRPGACPTEIILKPQREPLAH